jgi:hypothetical protein
VSCYSQLHLQRINSIIMSDLQCSIRQGVNPKLTDPSESEERWYHTLRARKTSRRLELFLLFLASIIATNCLIIFSSPESLSLTIDFTALITSGAAFFISATTTLWAQVRKYAARMVMRWIGYVVRSRSYLGLL